MKDLKPVDIVVIILALGIVLPFIAIIFNSIFTQVPNVGERLEVVQHIGTSIISIIGVYVGLKLKQ